ncbi:MAG: hemin uptake protein HemP [Chiayiivirga sp.]|nr:hemin uptake protein HemP [Chiayiivirga sp.]MCI1711204.1 hemin uptake protein HemP [Chiayiivirga sp.]MCI1727997.1 hemin uptake protein HemP [Chiayiivirga sp.]
MDSERRREPVAEAAVPVWRSEQLLQGQRELVIRHGEAWYRLRHTSNGKLILTK